MVSRLSGALDGGRVTPVNEELDFTSEWLAHGVLDEALKIANFRVVLAQVQGVGEEHDQTAGVRMQPRSVKLLVASPRRPTGSPDKSPGEM